MGLIALLEYIPFSLLTIALLLTPLRGNKRTTLHKAWLIVLGLACLSALYTGIVQIVGIIAIIAIAIALLAWSASNSTFNPVIRWLAGILFSFAAAILGFHMMPGIHSLLIIEKNIISIDAIPYSLYLNFDKVLIGLFIFGYWYQRPDYILTWARTGTTLLRWLPLILSSVILLSVLLNYIKYDAKLVDDLWLWIWANLFFTCVAEEAIFRGVIQHQLTLRLSEQKFGKWIACAIAAILFGLVHFGGGGLYVFISMLAGFGYGAVYAMTGRIEASIITHFLLNLAHILFFTYPALAIH